MDLITIMVVAIVLFLPAIVCRELKSYGRARAYLVLPFVWIFVQVVPRLVGTSGNFPLRDNFFSSADAALGVHVAGVVAWIAQHPAAGGVLNWSYNALRPLLLAAIFLPAILGREKTAWKFLLANVIAFAAAWPVFTLFPAVGPWAGGAFAPTSAQAAVEASIAALHAGHPAGPAGIVCFPSFHTVWAVFAGVALWPIKPVRIPAAILSSLIVVSTVTTGWHYAIDPMAGVFLAAGSWQAAELAWCRANRLFLKNPFFVLDSEPRQI